MKTTSIGLTFAGNTVTEGLFKFRSVTDEEDLDRVKKLLAGELYFSNYAQLNDPFEMRVQLALDKKSAKRIKGMNRSMKASKIFGGLAPAKRLQKAGQMADRLRFNTGILRNVAENHFARMKAECFIFCASATNLHPLLWSHYADKHTGVCVQFDHTVVPFSNLARVGYDKDFPVATYPFSDDISELTRKSILTKADYWNYEAEYRLFSVRMDNDAWHLGLQWSDDHTAHVSPESILGITLGAMIPADRKSHIVDYCKSNHPNLRINQARIRGDKYTLEIEPIDL